MSLKGQFYEHGRLLDPSFTDNNTYHDQDVEDYHHGPPNSRSFLQQAVRFLPRLSRSWLPFRRTRTRYHRLAAASFPASGMSVTRRILFFASVIPTIFIIVVILTAIFLPSYTNLPAHYAALHRRIQSSQLPGRANVNNEKVFIATSIYDDQGSLAGGAWGQALVDLIDMLGPDNVFLSVYENDPDPLSKQALDRLGERVPCNASMVSEHLPTANMSHVTLPTGEQALKRIDFLAQVRNRALGPLDDPASAAYHVHFDKLFFLNDVMFNPADAANLLFSTNVDEHGKAQYRAACATDFVNPWIFYDTFASRDLEGHSMGVTIYPWFSKSGQADSRNDVLSQTDAVRVRSCWGGMVAFDASWFQPDGVDDAFGIADLAVNHQHATSDMPDSTGKDSKTVTPPSTLTTEILAGSSASATHENQNGNLNWRRSTPFPRAETAQDVDPGWESVKPQTPLRFRATTDTFWDASECCLIHADLQGPRPANISAPTGIYINPYIRVAYDLQTLHWLPFTRRFERLLAPLQHLINLSVGLPRPNPRRLERPGEVVIDRIWTYDDVAQTHEGNRTSGYKDVKRLALPGSFCGGRKLLVKNEGQQESSWYSYEGVPRENKTGEVAV